MNEIETKFYEALTGVLERGFVIYQDQVVKIKSEEDWYSIQLNKKTVELQIVAQPKEELFDGYIPDFAIYLNNLLSGYVIEIDGHEWHEKTKEQARADKEKDRTYLKNRFIPIRFTGSEVYHNAKKCIDEVFEIIISNYEFFDYENQDIQNWMLYDRVQELERQVDDYEEKLKNYCYELNKIREGEGK